MKRLQFALTLMVSGLALKGLGIALYQAFHTPILARMLIACDPVGSRVADIIVTASFPRGIAPAGAPMVYEAVLIVVFAIECFVLGLGISELRRLFKQAAGSRQSR